MQFQLKIDCDNAAFEYDPVPETARILRALAHRLEHGDSFDKFRTVFDINGNDVGRAAFIQG